MDKRYQVFVSSTYEDLREERQEVMQALLELDCIPAGMELFPAADEDQWTLIKRVIDDCDYYVVVIGGRYGSIGPEGLSYTQMEYQYALAKAKPVIAFLHKDPGSLLVNKTEKTQEGRDKLESFRALVQQKMCKFWTTPSDLGSVVSRSLIKLIKTNPAIGWVKADLLPDTDTTEEILGLKRQIEYLKIQLEESKQASVLDLSQLAQGDDPIELIFSFSAFKSSSIRPDSQHTSKLLATWNEVFAAVSPLLVDEASDVLLKKALTDFVFAKIQSQLKAADEFVGYTLKNFGVDNSAFDTIKVQLLALRLMTKSTKKRTRSVNDRNTYWMLTPHGENVMMNLRAIRRPAENS